MGGYNGKDPDSSRMFLLIAALIFSAGYYSAPIFFTIQRILIVLGRRLFYDSKRSIGEVLFLITFVGVNFEAGNETREKF